MNASSVTSAADRLRAAIGARSRAEIDEAVAIADFAAENEWPADAEIDLVGQRPARIGADGTPVLNEFVALELAALKGISVGAATWMIRDIVNLRFRHPRLWSRVRAGAIPVFRACQLAAEMARYSLSPEQLEQLDDELAGKLSRLPWRRLVTLCRGRIADLVPDQLVEQARNARAERYVRKLPTDDPTIAYLSARVDTADAVFFDAMVDRIADLLHTHGDDDTKEVRRAKSVGILATPARATLLLAEAAGHLTAANDHDETDAVLSSVGTEHRPLAGRVGSDGPDHLVGQDHLDGLVPATDGGDRFTPGEETTHWWVGGEAEVGAPCQADGPDQVTAVHTVASATAAAATTAAAVDTAAVDTAAGVAAVWRCAKAALPAIRWTDPKLLPKSTIYLHIAEDTVMHGRGPVRAENIGPIAATMLGLLVGHTRINLTPVIRPYDEIVVDAYEVPDRIREQVILRDQIEVFPYSSRPARNQQLDHTIAYRKGQLSQTKAANLGPLSSKVHRGKTHGHWNLDQPRPGIFWWKSPAGFRYRVTPGGVTRIRSDSALDRAFGRALRDFDHNSDIDP